MMAFKCSTSLLLLPLLLLALVVSSHAGSIAVYWGQNTNEGSLVQACDSGNYAFVMIAYLSVFGDGRSFGNGDIPILNLSAHCNPANGGCAGLSTDIKACQAKGVKVFLSIGGRIPGYLLLTAADAHKVADYLWSNYLGGHSHSRPFGDAVVDGIDFDIEFGGTQHYDELAKALTNRGGNVSLSAAPQYCPYPDKYLDTAIRTGLFDYLWVRFYDYRPTCTDEGGPGYNLQTYWDEWNSMPVKQVFWGVTNTVQNSYFGPGIMTSQVLPHIKGSPKYGGIMLWDRFFDLQTGYSNAVKSSV